MTNEELVDELVEETYYQGEHGRFYGDSAYEHQVLAKLNRCDELQAIVDRLPKTADNFPAYRGLRLWEPLVDIDQGGNKFIYDYGDMTVNYLESEKYIAGCYRHHPTTGKTVEESES
jgi:hypothetical protein